MDQTTYNEIFNDPSWHKMLDFIAVLIVGLLMGATIAYAMFFIRSQQSQIVPENSNVTPAGFKIEQA